MVKITIDRNSLTVRLAPLEAIASLRRSVSVELESVEHVEAMDGKRSAEQCMADVRFGVVAGGAPLGGRGTVGKWRLGGVRIDLGAGPHGWRRFLLSTPDPEADAAMIRFGSYEAWHRPDRVGGDPDPVVARASTAVPPRRTATTGLTAWSPPRPTRTGTSPTTPMATGRSVGFSACGFAIRTRAGTV